MCPERARDLSERRDGGGLGRAEVGRGVSCSGREGGDARWRITAAHTWPTFTVGSHLASRNFLLAAEKRFGEVG